MPSHESLDGRATTTRLVARCSRSRGDSEGAVEAYTQALGHYDTEKLALPPDIDCAYGAALAGGEGEEGARRARCARAAPLSARGAGRQHAARSRAGRARESVGRRARSAGARRAISSRIVYLTKSAARPATDKLVITATGSPAAPAKIEHARERQARRGGSPQLRSSRAGRRTTAATQEGRVDRHDRRQECVHRLGVRRRRRGHVRVQARSAGEHARGQPEAAADSCVRADRRAGDQEPQAIRDAFTTRLAITIK